MSSLDRARGGARDNAPVGHARVPSPRPLAALRRARPRTAALFFDIDDTLTTHGKLGVAAYAALWRAREAGLLTVPVTGRPAGWCDHIARVWPVSGVVGENGACAFWHDGKKLRRLDVASAVARAKNRRRLDALARSILRAVPGSGIASDQPYREYDLAIDYCEDVRRLGRPAVEKIVGAFARAGATAKVSSIHVNGWFGRYDKLSMAERFAREVLGFEPGVGWARAAFVGDSPNDQPMFGAFACSIGVANVRPFLKDLTAPPKFITRRAGGEGFAEAVASLGPTR